jgi:hypothetical protein
MRGASQLIEQSPIGLNSTTSPHRNALDRTCQPGLVPEYCYLSGGVTPSPPNPHPTTNKDMCRLAYSDMQMSGICNANAIFESYVNRVVRYGMNQCLASIFL